MIAGSLFGCSSQRGLAADTSHASLRSAGRRRSAGTATARRTGSSVDVTRPPRITTAIGCSISWPGMLPAIDQRQQRQAGAQRRHQDRRQAFAGAAQDQRQAERLAFDLLEMLVVLDQHDAVARGDAEHREEADQRAERDDAGRRRRPRARRRPAPPAAPGRSGRRAASRAATRAGSGRSPIAATIEHRSRSLLRRLAFLVFAQQLRRGSRSGSRPSRAALRRRRPPSRGRAP